MKHKLSILIFILLIVPLLCSFVQAADHIIVNSEDWKDVYSTILYSNLVDTPKNFLVSDRHSRIIAQTLERSKEEILLIESSSVPFVIGYESVLEDVGFDVEVITGSDINLDLAKRTETTSFVVIDDSYGYNAIAVAPYAALTKAFVIFSDRRNIDEVVDFLESRDLGELIVYGHVDREVKEALDVFDPEIINLQDRFDNNIAIVKKYQEKSIEIRGSVNKQVILSNGEFIEEEIMSGIEPVLFLGKQNVPEQIKDYITSSDIEIGVLIGNQYVGAATSIRRQLGISVFVKFARGARVPEGSISPVEGLDLFYVPTYAITLEVAGIRYNYATNQLEVTIRNTGELAVYFKGSYELASELGTFETVGDMESVFLYGNSLKTLTYDAELTGENLTASAFVLYGESPRALESEIREKYPIEGVRILDNSQIELIGVLYDLKKGLFYIEVQNTGEVPAFVDIELINLIIDEEQYSFGSTEPVEIAPGKSEKIRVRPKPVLTELDLADNEEVTVQANYGERSETLVKTIRQQFALVVKRIDFVYYGSIALVVIALLLMIFFLKKKKCRSCGHKNKRTKSHCKKCGSKL